MLNKNEVTFTSSWCSLRPRKKQPGRHLAFSLIQNAGVKVSLLGSRPHSEVWFPRALSDTLLLLWEGLWFLTVQIQCCIPWSGCAARTCFPPTPTQRHTSRYDLTTWASHLLGCLPDSGRFPGIVGSQSITCLPDSPTWVSVSVLKREAASRDNKGQGALMQLVAVHISWAAEPPLFF